MPLGVCVRFSRDDTTMGTVVTQGDGTSVGDLVEVRSRRACELFLRRGQEEKRVKEREWSAALLLVLMAPKVVMLRAFFHIVFEARLLVLMGSIEP